MSAFKLSALPPMTSAQQQQPQQQPPPPTGAAGLWSEKYRPRRVADMCYPANGSRLVEWLRQWMRVPPPINSTSTKRGALLSGPPGVGKTTSVHAAAAELGLRVIEFNASDQRSMRTVRETIGDLIDNRAFFELPSDAPAAAAAAAAGNPFASTTTSAAASSAGAIGKFSAIGGALGGGSAGALPKRTTFSPSGAAPPPPPAAPTPTGPATPSRPQRSVSDLDSGIIAKSPSSRGPGVASGQLSAANLGDAPEPVKAEVALHSSQHLQKTFFSMRPFIVLMDEVDGCDRGGVAELIKLIRTSRCPIICTCNDRWHQKLRSLVNYCEDFKFTRPPYNAVAAWLQRYVLPAEGVTVPALLLQDVIKEGGNDIRSILNNLQMWSMTRKNFNEQQLAVAALASRKNEEVGMFDAAEMLLKQGYQRDGSDAVTPVDAMPMEQRFRMYYGTDLLDLFVHENYPHFKTSARISSATRPAAADRIWMNSIAQAAHSIARGDVMSRQIFSEQQWGMGAAQAFRSAIDPAATVRGRYESFVTDPRAAQFDRARPIKFPTWLGVNSTTTKFRRIASCLVRQGQHPVTGYTITSGEDFATEYGPVLLARILEPLAEASQRVEQLRAAAVASSAASGDAAEGGGAAKATRAPTVASIPAALAAQNEGIAAATAIMDQYHILRDDVEELEELVRFKKQVRVSLWSVRLNYSAQVTSAVKSAFTRTFNKTHKGQANTVAKVIGRSSGGGEGATGRTREEGAEDAAVDDDDDATSEAGDGEEGADAGDATARSSTDLDDPAFSKAAKLRRQMELLAARRGSGLVLNVGAAAAAGTKAPGGKRATAKAAASSGAAGDADAAPAPKPRAKRAAAASSGDGPAPKPRAKAAAGSRRTREPDASETVTLIDDD